MAAATTIALGALAAVSAGTTVYSAVQNKKQAKRAASDMKAPTMEDVQEVRKSSELPEAENKQSQLAQLQAQKKKRRQAAGRQGTNITGGSVLGGVPSTTSKTVLGG